MNFVRTGNFVAASRTDSRATDSVTPSSSNKMFPGRTVATQCSGCPLPLPIRVSGGRAVTDLSGKMRIQSLPLRFILRVSATRAASIWVFVIQARSSVCRPNSPKSIRKLRDAVPLRLPRWDLRYFTRLGINGMTNLPRVEPPRLVTAVVAAAAQPAPAFPRPLLPSYKSNTSLQSSRKRCWLRKIRNRSLCAGYAAAPYLGDTIRSAKFPLRSIDPSCADEFRARRNPSPFAPLFSSPADTRYAARFAAPHFPRPAAHPAQES